MNLLWADRLRNLSTLLVVLIHVAAPVADVYDPAEAAWWWKGNWWNSLARAGVPVFVMLSGFLLLGKDYPTGDFLKKRFSRVLVPALFWMAFYCFQGYLRDGNPGSLGQVLRYIVEDGVRYHFWFIYLIIGLYTFYPILRPWIRQARDRDYYYLFALCAAASWGYKILYCFWGIRLGIYWEYFSNNLGYFVLGYYLGQKVCKGKKTPNPLIKPWKINRKSLIIIALGLIAAGTVATVAGAWYLKTQVPCESCPRYFYDYLTPNVGFAAIGWFLLARHGFHREPLLEVESKLADTSFGVYLSHVMVLEFWSQTGYWHSRWHHVWNIPGLTLMVYLTSFLLVLTIRTLVPFGKKIT